jgi:hypothetical protein
MPDRPIDRTILEFTRGLSQPSSRRVDVPKSLRPPQVVNWREMLSVGRRHIEEPGSARHHDMKQRLARWLLMSHDRAGSDHFPLTQEFMAQMLGVRRATATEAAQALQKQGLIRYKRGMMTIVERPGLVTAACVCYRTIVDDFEKLIPTNLMIPGNMPAPWGIEEEREGKRSK